MCRSNVWSPTKWTGMAIRQGCAGSFLKNQNSPGERKKGRRKDGTVTKLSMAEGTDSLSDATYLPPERAERKNKTPRGGTRLIGLELVPEADEFSRLRRSVEGEGKRDSMTKAGKSIRTNLFRRPRGRKPLKFIIEKAWEENAEKETKGCRDRLASPTLLVPTGTATIRYWGVSKPPRWGG